MRPPCYWAWSLPWSYAVVINPCIKGRNPILSKSVDNFVGVIHNSKLGFAGVLSPMLSVNTKKIRNEIKYIGEDRSKWQLWISREELSTGEGENGVKGVSARVDKHAQSHGSDHGVNHGVHLAAR